MALQPLEDRIVVRPSESEEKTASGLVIPDTAKEKPQQGEVLAVGPGRRADNTGELVDTRLEAAAGRLVELEGLRHYFFTFASTSRLVRMSRSSASTVISVPPYFE